MSSTSKIYSSTVPPVGVILVNWNEPEDTLRCLESLTRLKYGEFFVVVCDNGSIDDSVGRILNSSFAQARGTALFSEQDHDIHGTCERADQVGMAIVRCERNHGFAKANNIGLRFLQLLYPQTEFIWLLNTDTVVDPFALAQLVDAVSRDARIGAVQSLLLNYTDPERIDSAGIAIRRRGGAFDYLQGESLALVRDRMHKEVFGCCAASALYRRSVVETTGLFDERYFVVNEDVDLAFRLRQAGFRSELVTASVVYHKRGISGAGRSRLVAFIARRNKTWLMSTWWPRSVAIPLILVNLAIVMVSGLAVGRAAFRLGVGIDRILGGILAGAPKQLRRANFEEWAR